MKNLTTNKTLALALLAGLTASYSVAQVTDQQVQDINKKVEKNTAYISNLKATIDGVYNGLNRAHDGVGKNFDNIRKLGAETKNINKSVRQNEAAILSLGIDIDNLGTGVRKLATEMGNINETLDSVQSTVNSHEVQFEALNKITQGHELRVSENEFDIKTNKADIAQNKSDIATNKAGIAQNKSDIATNKAGIAQNKSDIATNKAGVAQNKSDIATNKAGMAQYRSSIAKNIARISNLEGRVDRLEKSVKRSFAAQSALIGLFQPYNVGKFNLSTAVGGYNSETAFAIGSGYRFNQNVAAKAGIAMAPSSSSVSYNAGINFEW
ncbi:YadA C-terminal domain-containing protein [Rodentibacter pneumotropicus]|uniref:YadA C-terminal domain-containing protein n=1 Tax=Rodentibacter pneumotropicus TaxID=758 RepID=UPI00232D7C04|nr:YadA C-terminal domain-containing protein [Rodentibacter pneumotropicus]MDC2826429.1 YadA C-terminal domain-containing protein [Rodentibacter pneumotropicus]